MKKQIVVITLGIASLAAAPAFAQSSSVTLYGILDIGLNHTSNKDGSNLNELRSGNAFSSRFGFRGREDLGSGLSAMFNLESGLSLDTGAASSTFWNRQSWVGVAMQGVGQVTAGLQLPTISDVFVLSASAAYFGNQGAALDGAAAAAGSTAARFNNMIGGIRSVNAIKFNSADFAGFKLGAMTALGEGAATNGRTDSVGLSYGFSQFEAGVAYHRTNCAGGSSCAAGTGDDKITGIGAAYKFGQGGRIGAFMTREKNAKNVLGNDADVMSLMAVVPLSSWTLLAGYQTLNDKSAANQDIKQLNLGVKYLLSKRTELYSLYSAQRVDNGGRASMYGELSSDSKQSQFNVGLRHFF